MTICSSRDGFSSKNRLLTKAVFALLVCLTLASCKTTQGEGLDLSEFQDGRPAKERFAICSGYGCAFQSKVHLSGGEWRQVRAVLANSKDPAQERRNIAAAIALLEQLTGRKTGTENDHAGAAVFDHDKNQMDCVDEAINTSHYLRFIDGDGLLKWHKAGDPIRRGNFIDGAWPHNTATIRETATGQSFAVDSWYGKNGEKPHIVTAEVWLSGWRP